MRKSKWHANKSPTQSKLPQRLVAAWRDEIPATPFGEILDAMALKPDPVALLQRAVTLVEPEDRLDFIEDMHSDASMDFTHVETGRGSVMCRMTLFTLALHGPKSGFDALIDPDAPESRLTALVKLFRSCGLAQKNSNVFLAPVFLDPITAALASPFDVRNIVQDFAEVQPNGVAPFAHLEALARERDVSLAQPPSAAPVSCASAETASDSVQIVTRLLLGCRMIPVTDTDVMTDLLDGDICAGCPDGDDPEHTCEQSDLYEAALERFVEAAFDVLDGTCLVVGGPYDWTGGIRALGALHLQGVLLMDAAMSGVALDGTGEAHVTIDDEAITVVAKVGDIMLGPAEMSVEMLVFGTEAIEDWLAMEFASVVEHQNRSALMAAVGLQASTMH